MALLLMDTTPIEDACSLPFLQQCELEEMPKYLKKGISMMNAMIELEYIVASEGGIQFTNSGITYMINKYGVVMADYKGKTIDFGLVDQFMENQFGKDIKIEDGIKMDLIPNDFEQKDIMFPDMTYKFAMSNQQVSVEPVANHTSNKKLDAFYEKIKKGFR